MWYDCVMHFSLDDIPQLIEAFWYISASVPQGLVLGYCGFGGLVGTSPCMAKLNLKTAATAQA